MAAARKIFIFLVMISSVYQISATTYSLENLALISGSPGGLRFDQTFGNSTILAVLSKAKDFIVEQFSLSPPKLIDHVVLYVESIDGVAFSVNGTIHLSAGYVERYNPGNTTALISEITGIMFHEMTHVVQNNADGVPGGVIEGIADFIRLRAGYGIWMRQRGSTWDAGYSTTAFFFDWIDKTITSNFVNKLNLKIGQASAGWDVNVFVDLTGKNVNALWTEYQSSI